MKKFFVVKEPQKFTKMTFFNMMWGNFRQKITTQYLRFGPFAYKNLKILTFLTREKVK